MNKLSVVPLAQPQANAECIYELEQMLAQAREGKFDQLFVVGMDTRTSTAVRARSERVHIQLIGAVSQALFEMQHFFAEESPAEPSPAA